MGSGLLVGKLLCENNEVLSLGGKLVNRTVGNEREDSWRASRWAKIKNVVQATKYRWEAIVDLAALVPPHAQVEV